MWRNYLLLFVSSACVMTLELVAGRLVAPYIGVSLYTWTGIIGACLCGMSFGNLFGGWLADRGEPQRWVGRILLMAAGLVAALLLFQPFIRTTADALIKLQLPPQLGIFALSIFLFGIPCFFMAAVSPLVYKMALQDASKLGSTVGRLAASGITGSIIGTYATGFWLIPTFGTQTIVVGITLIMGTLGAYTLTWSLFRRAITAATLLFLPWYAFSAFPAIAEGPCDVESAYYCIRVSTTDKGGKVGIVKQMRLDYLVHSGYRVADPDHLWYEYEQVASWIMAAREQEDARTLFLGGGGYILPHWVEKNFPDATVDVVEIDPGVTKVALAEFVPGSKRITSYNMDARMAMVQLPRNQNYDIIFGDVFNDLSVPYHLVTREFAELVESRLTDDGIYLVNVVDRREEGLLLGAIATTLKEVFPYVYTLPGMEWSKSFVGRTPHIVVAALKPIPWAEWEEHGSKPRFSVTPFELKGDHMVLTDQYAPTDNLLRSVFVRRWQSQ